MWISIWNFSISLNFFNSKLSFSLNFIKKNLINKKWEIIIIDRFSKIFCSIIVFDHNCIEILETDFSISIWVCLFHHQFQSFLINILFKMSVDFSQIINVNMTLVSPVVFLENSSDLFSWLINVRLCIHGFHKLTETNPTCFLSIELGNNLIHCLFIGLKSILCQQ